MAAFQVGGQYADITAKGFGKIGEIVKARKSGGFRNGIPPLAEQIAGEQATAVVDEVHDGAAHMPCKQAGKMVAAQIDAHGKHLKGQRLGKMRIDVFDGIFDRVMFSVCSSAFGRNGAMAEQPDKERKHRRPDGTRTVRAVCSQLVCSRGKQPERVLVADAIVKANRAGVETASGGQIAVGNHAVITGFPLACNMMQLLRIDDKKLTCLGEIGSAVDVYGRRPCEKKEQFDVLMPIDRAASAVAEVRGILERSHRVQMKDDAVILHEQAMFFVHNGIVFHKKPRNAQNIVNLKQ